MTRRRGTERVSDAAQRPLRVVHLNHTTVAGGAELALARMLQAGPGWSACLLLAPSSDGGPGAFDSLPATIRQHVSGVRHPAGASAGGVRSALTLGFRILAQAVVTRFSRDFAEAAVMDANSTRSAAYGGLAARWSRKPFVVHLRDVVDARVIGASGHALMVRMVLPRADGVIANSRTTLESALPHLRPGVVAEVIPSASGLRITPNGDSAESRTRAPLAGRPVRTVGMLARIDPWKGQHQVLEAFARVYRGRDVRLQFAGDAPFGHEDYAEELQLRADALGVAGQVDFLGHVNDIDALLDTWEVGVHASTRIEPLGQNVLQYLAAGRAVVAVDEGGPKEWIEHGVNGLLVPPRDIDALAVALHRLDVDAALRTRLSAEAPRTPGLLDDAAVARAHEAFYRRVVAAVDASRPGSGRAPRA